MKTIADAISTAHLTWRGCLPHQCTKECPHLAPKKRPVDGLCERYALHLAGAAWDAIEQKAGESALIETIPTDYTESSKQAMRKAGFTEDDPRN